LVKPTKVALSRFTVGVVPLKGAATATPACKTIAVKSDRYILSEMRECKTSEGKKVNNMHCRKPWILL
jgi:hypothetical protein